VEDRVSWAFARAHVDQQARPALGRQPRRVDSLGAVQSLAGVAQLHRHGDPVQRDVGWAELGVEVVPVRAEPPAGVLRR
jgi:hypothetical protein